MMNKCPICEGEGKEIFKGVILKKYEIQYYQCPICAFIYTESPYWLEEAYGDDSAVAETDTGIMQRNIVDVLMVNMLVKLFFCNGKVFVDKGGGYGIFTRMMRDLGYNWLWDDKYANNLVARGFEYCYSMEKEGKEEVDLITAFELFEHFDEPLKEIKNLLAISKNIIFSTEIYDDGYQYKQFDDWWYYAPHTGQHISFYSKRTLEYIAATNQVHYYKINNQMHLFTKDKISRRKQKLLKIANLWFVQYYYYHKRLEKGLAFSDMQELSMRK